ncbi:hypothetical protein ABV409_12350 [Flagellimonas sp. DF-77]|uniref:hypothetical protein n=1 Tax=Flagellimonas algarum TaxID=3230298 RepID=UPI003390F9B8
MRTSIRIPIAMYTLFSMWTAFGQKPPVEYDLKKGQVFDVLMVTTKKGSKEAFKTYREKAFPVAVEMGYSFLPGFTIEEVVQGSFEPKGVVFGSWTSLAQREGFLDVIEDRVPEFHGLRKEIWSVFNVTYYEIQKDLSIRLDPNKVIVATAIWKKQVSEQAFDNFLSDWKTGLEHSNGTIKITLVDGKSPAGYEYDPDILFLSQWNSREEFEVFQKANLGMDPEILKNSHQFILMK